MRAVLVLGAVYAVELLCGLLVPRDFEFKALALPPWEDVRYEARDFQFAVSTNQLGFRGPEFPIERTQGVRRAVVLGNSFTYGWGVGFSDTWPHLLERHLTAAGRPIEVANLATPGTSVAEMEKIARNSIPLLRPDIVILSVLQGASFVTLQHQPGGEGERQRPQDAKSWLREVLARALPNYMRLLQGLRHELSGRTTQPAFVVQNQWKTQAAEFVKKMTPEQSERFERLDEGTRDRFMKGQLNSPAVIAALGSPAFFVDTVKNAAVIENGVAGMRGLFSRVKALAAAQGATVVVVSMPYGAYLGGEAAENLRRLGFDIPDFLVKDRTTEDALAAVARETDVAFVSLLEDFHAVNTDKMFIPFDGHYNAEGTRFYARLLSQKLLEHGF